MASDYITRVAAQAKSLPVWMLHTGFQTFHRDRQRNGRKTGGNMRKKDRQPEDYLIRLWRDRETDTFVAKCQEIPCCTVAAKTPADALDLVYAAIRDYIAYVRKLGGKEPNPEVGE